MLNVKQGSCKNQLLKSFGLTRPGNRPRSTEYVTDDLTTEPRACGLVVRFNTSDIHRMNYGKMGRRMSCIKGGSHKGASLTKN